MGNPLWVYWAIVFLVAALIAAFVVAGAATEFAQILFGVAIILVLLSFVGGMLRRRN